MNLCCQLCGAWAVPVTADTERWRRADGATAEFLAGCCESCGSRNLADPSMQGVEIVKARLAVMKAATA